LFKSVHFYIENVTYLCFKVSCLIEEVSCTEPSSS
jgi:hypothetical protein